MAFSGIQEHNEARRKQMHMERLSILHKTLNDKYRTAFETELADRNRINSDNQCGLYHSCCVARRRFAYDAERAIPTCRMLDQHCPHVYRVESQDMAHSRPIGKPQPSYKCAYDATQNGMAVTCHHSADCYAQDVYLINPDNQPDLWKRPHAYRVPMRADGNDTTQYTPYAEMFSAKLPKRFTTTDYLMQW